MMPFQSTLAAYEYVANGKPGLGWVMEPQSVTTDKDSGIVNGLPGLEIK
jgi:predicted helicase